MLREYLYQNYEIKIVIAQIVFQIQYTKAPDLFTVKQSKLSL